MNETLVLLTDVELKVNVSDCWYAQNLRSRAGHKTRGRSPESKAGHQLEEVCFKVNL